MQQTETSKPKVMELHPLIFCYLCRGYLINPVTTRCSHTFCQFCLMEYFNFFSQCPQCCKFIRGYTASHNRPISRFVRYYVSSYSPIDKQLVDQKETLQKQYLRHLIRHNIVAGQKIDARDEKHIWREARVIKTFLKSNPQRSKFVRFVYLDSNEEEELSEDSERIAPIGFNSHRDELPKYYSGSLLIHNQYSDEYYVYQDQS